MSTERSPRPNPHAHNYQGGAGRRQNRQSGWSQATTRNQIHSWDQHGREWWFSVEKKTNMPVGMITPCFAAPWIPDQQYLKVNPDNPSELFIDYRAMSMARRARMVEYHTSVKDYCRKAKRNVPPLGDYDDEIRQAVGAPPKPFEPVIAALQNNTYILGPDYAEMMGLEYRVDSRLEKYVTELTADAFVDQYDFSDRSFADAKADASPVQPETADESDDVDWTGVTEDEQQQAFAELAAEPQGEASEESEAEFDKLIDELDVEEEYDADAVGGRTIAPHQVERAARQALRRPTSNPVRAKHGAHRGQKAVKSANAHPSRDQRAKQRGDRPTLASGAPPAIAGGGLEE